jgi:uncharacterized peroxidase-related enzyme
MEHMFLKDVEEHRGEDNYSRFIDAMQNSGPEYPQILHMFAFKMKATVHLERFTQEILREPAPLSPGFRELIAAYTSHLNQCPFWTKSHAAVAAELLGSKELVHGVLADLDSSALPDSDKALLRFVRKVNEDSVAVQPDDIAHLHAHGFSDEAIYYAITVCALFNFYNRWIDASGVHPMSDEAHAAGAKRSAVHGYSRSSQTPPAPPAK